MDANTRFEENTSLVYFLLHKYYPEYAYNEDIQQIGMLGLWVACINFDESKGYSFSTFASKCIYNRVACYFRKENKINKLPTTTIEQCADYWETSEDTLPIFEDTEDKYSYKEILDSIDYVLDHTIIKYRKIIELYLKGVDQHTIGREVGYSQPQVSRIIKKFRKDMEVELYEDSCRRDALSS